MNNKMDLYPSGAIEYEFRMYAFYDYPIACSLNHPNVREIILEKLNSADEFDPKWRMIIKFGPICSIGKVDEFGSIIKDQVFDRLLFILKTNITDIIRIGHSLTPRPGEGSIIYASGFKSVPQIRMKNSCSKLSDQSVHEIQSELSRISASQRNPYLSLFRNAIESTDPVVQFLMLYLILYDMYSNQKEVDNQILLKAPSPETPVSSSSFNGKPETIYTKLRNEITHRVEASPEITRAEVLNYLDRFREIVHKILHSTS